MKEIRRLDRSEKEEYKRLKATVLGTLTDKSWLIPFTEEVEATMFDVDSTLLVYGCFVDGVLAAVSTLDTDKAEFFEVAEAAGMPMEKKGGELGGSMVLPEYRGQNLMWEINSVLFAAARDMGFAYLVATAYPDNIASNTSLLKLGLDYKKTIIRTGSYTRNVYGKEL